MHSLRDHHRGDACAAEISTGRLDEEEKVRGIAAPQEKSSCNFLSLPLSHSPPLPLITPDLSHHIKSLIGTRKREREGRKDKREGGRGTFVRHWGSMVDDPPPPPDVAQAPDTDIIIVRAGRNKRRICRSACLFGRFTRSAAQATKATPRRDARYNLQSAC